MAALETTPQVDIYLLIGIELRSVDIESKREVIDIRREREFAHIR